MNKRGAVSIRSYLRQVGAPRLLSARRRRLVCRASIVASIGLVAVVCLSSSLFAWCIGAVTIAVVVCDMVVQSRPEAADVLPSREPTPRKLTVDLRRRS